MSPPIEHLVHQAHQSGKALIFDADDLIFEPGLVDWHRAVSDLSAVERELHIEGVRRYRMTLLACDAAILATPLLAQFAHGLGLPAYVHRNSLGGEMLTLAQQLRSRRRRRPLNERLVIGYGSGTPTHNVDFEEATAALAGILNRYPQVELWIVGPLTVSQKLTDFGKRIVRFPLTDWRGWFELLDQMDIAIAPLEMGNVFCRAKSEIKFVEAAALGIPVVASDIDPFRDSMRQGYDGFLAANEEEWSRLLSVLIQEPEQRRLMGERARQTVLRRDSWQTRANELAAILPSLMNSVSHSRPAEPPVGDRMTSNAQL